MHLAANCSTIRMSAFVAGAVLTCTSAFAQSSRAAADLPEVQADHIGNFTPCEEPTWVGTYYVATDTFVPADQASEDLLALGLIYNNTCIHTGTNFTRLLNGQTMIDDGRVPSLTSAPPNTGSVNSYFVTKYNIGYVTGDLTGNFAIRVRFWQAYADCASLAAAGAPTSNILLTGIPGSATHGVLAGFTLTIDLTGSGLEFCMLADANGAFDADPVANGFGFGFTMESQVFGSTTSTAGGPILRGRLVTTTTNVACPAGTGTYYNTPGAARGTGLDNADLLWFDNGIGGGACTFFGGSPSFPYAGLSLTMTADPAIPDCDADGFSDICEIAGGAPDCNTNGIPDACDIAGGAPDCDSNGIPDSCDIAGGAPDCDTNGIPDACDIAGGAPDCNSNGIPDACDIAGGAPDCDSNGIPDVCDIAGGAPDCQPNGIPDACDIAGGGSMDLNANGIPDECEPFGLFEGFCYPDLSGVQSCPCANPQVPALSNKGCDSFIAPATLSGTGGAELTATGTATASIATTLVFHVTGAHNNAVNQNLHVFFMGTATLPGGVKNGFGIRCVTAVSRIYTGLGAGTGGLSSTNAIDFPNGTQTTDPWTASGTPAPGQTRYYYDSFRDQQGPTTCLTAFDRFNISNAGSIIWAP